MTSRTFVFFTCTAIAAVLLGVAIWFFAMPRIAPEKLTIGYSSSLPDIPTIIAKEKGYFQEEGLDMQYRTFQAGKLSMEAMLREETDVATVAETPIVLQSFQRQDFAVFGSFVRFSTIRILAAKETGIRQPSDLRGHRVGVMFNTSAHFFLETLLLDASIAPDEISVVDLPVANYQDDLSQNKIAAVAAFQPAAYNVEAALGSRIVSLPYEKIRYQESFNFVAKRAFLQKHPAAAQRLLRATMRAIQWSAEHKAEAIDIVTRHTKMDTQAVRSLWDDYRFSLGLNQALIGSLESQARWAIRKGMVKAVQVPNYLEFLDAAPLRSVAPKTVTIVLQ